MTTNIECAGTPNATSFTVGEARAIEALRVRYEEDHDLLSVRERAHLCFIRWLVSSDRLES